MAELQLVLFDDAVARRWMPFALTRPAGDLLFGCFTQRQRSERLLGARCIGYVSADALRGFDEPDSPHVLEQREPGSEAARVFVSSRWVGDWGPSLELGGKAATLTCGGVPCGWLAPPNTPNPQTSALVHPEGDTGDRGASVEIGGRLLEHVWDLITGNADQIERDFEGARTSAGGRHSQLPEGTAALGSPRLMLAQDVAIEPSVVLDFRDGPIWLEPGVRVQAFSRVAGPAYIGRNSTLLGGPFAAVSIGPTCKVHGELEESVILGYSNKAHDGFLGHAYLGQWVNLGALTTNSDLKNNYGSVRIWTPEGERDTGVNKLGCLLGDHVKTAIGTMLNTGTVVGAGANLFGRGMPPKFVPPFSWGFGDEASEYSLERFLETATTVMARRQIALSDAQRRLLAEAWRSSRARAPESG